jgi:hypothetical protein
MIDPTMEQLVEVGGFSPGTYMIVSGPIKSSSTSTVIFDEPSFYKEPDEVSNKKQEEENEDGLIRRDIGVAGSGS